MHFSSSVNLEEEKAFETIIREISMVGLPLMVSGSQA